MYHVYSAAVEVVLMFAAMATRRVVFSAWDFANNAGMSQRGIIHKPVHEH
jgi:hypothetical protein